MSSLHYSQFIVMPVQLVWQDYCLQINFHSFCEQCIAVYDRFKIFVLQGETPIRHPKIVPRKFTFTCRGVEEGQENLKRLVALNECQAKTLERCRTMRREMTEFEENFKKQVHAIHMLSLIHI